MSLSNVRSLRMADQRVVIGEYTIDVEAEKRAEELLTSEYPELMVITTVEGKRQLPLQQLLIIEQRHRNEIEAASAQRYEEGRTEGYEAGYAAGLNEGQKDARQVVSSLSGLVQDVTQQRHALLAEAKERVIELILKVSQRLTFMQATLDPEITRSIISGAIEQLLDKSKIVVKVNPDHLPVLEQQIDAFRGSNTAIKEIRIEADPRVRYGGCFIETASGDIDARLESMYDIIREAIVGAEEV